MGARAHVCLVTLLLATAEASGLAQAPASKSAPLAKELVAALEAKKLDSIAAKVPSAPDVYVGALYMSGVQLLIVSGSYQEPILLDTRLLKKEYRDVYIDLNGASPVASRILIEDLGADGLKAKREKNAPVDTVELTGKRTMFDSEWKKQKISEEEYLKTFATADDRYAQILTALLTEIKKGS
jgi:hypothetical protein